GATATAAHHFAENHKIEKRHNTDPEKRCEKQLCHWVFPDAVIFFSGKCGVILLNLIKFFEEKLQITKTQRIVRFRGEVKSGERTSVRSGFFAGEFSFSGFCEENIG